MNRDKSANDHVFHLVKQDNPIPLQLIRSFKERSDWFIHTDVEDGFKRVLKVPSKKQGRDTRTGY